jgi:hypothetical protein
MGKPAISLAGKFSLKIGTKMKGSTGGTDNDCMNSEALLILLNN